MPAIGRRSCAGWLETAVDNELDGSEGGQCRRRRTGNRAGLSRAGAAPRTSSGPSDDTFGAQRFHFGGADAEPAAEHIGIVLAKQR
jgi:hypothetical protein